MKFFHYIFVFLLQSRYLRTVLRFLLFFILFQGFSLFSTTVLADELNDHLTSSSEEPVSKKLRDFAIIVGIVAFIYILCNVAVMYEANGTIEQQNTNPETGQILSHKNREYKPVVYGDIKPTYTIPGTTLSIGTPSIATVPSIATPSIATPSIATPSIATPSIATPSIATPSIATPSIATPSIATPSIDSDPYLIAQQHETNIQNASHEIVRYLGKHNGTYMIDRDRAPIMGILVDNNLDLLDSNTQNDLGFAIESFLLTVPNMNPKTAEHTAYCHIASASIWQQEIIDNKRFGDKAGNILMTGLVNHYKRQNEQNE